jgi:hypothetical protein
MYYLVSYNKPGALPPKPFTFDESRFTDCRTG